MAKITDKQKTFVQEYIANGCNATQAYISAGYSQHKADTNAANLLKKPHVNEYLKQLQSEQSNSINKTKEDLLNRLWDITLDGTDSNSIRAGEVINKMMGWNEAEKKDITLKGEQPLFGEEETDE